jgi:hypothetical protein
MAANNYQQQQQQAQMQQNWSYNQPQQNPYMINPMYSQTAPMAAQQNISLTSPNTNNTNNNQFTNFQSSTTTTTTNNVNHIHNYS